MSTKPKLTIAINSYRNAQMLKLCIQSVLDTVHDIDYELIVADSATQDDTKDLMRQEFPQAIFLPDEKNIGFGAMVNKCLNIARGEFVFLINADTILEPGTASDLMEYLVRNPRVGIVAPAQKNFNGEIAQTCFRFYQPMTILYRRTPLGRLPFGKAHLAQFEMHDYDRRHPQKVDWVIGSAMMARASVIKEVGGMDPRFFMYMEDVDWCRRFWMAGYAVVFHPGITLYHYYGKGSAKGSLWQSVFFNKLTRIHIASAIKYFWKYRGAKSPRNKLQKT